MCCRETDNNGDNDDADDDGHNDDDDDEDYGDGDDENGKEMQMLHCQR